VALIRARVADRSRCGAQTVPHLHIHLIPRYAGDRDDPRGGVRWVLPERAAYWNEVWPSHASPGTDVHTGRVL